MVMPRVVAASSAQASWDMRSNGVGWRSTTRTVAPVNTGSAYRSCSVVRPNDALPAPMSTIVGAWRTQQLYCVERGRTAERHPGDRRARGTRLGDGLRRDPHGRVVARERWRLVAGRRDGTASRREVPGHESKWE